MNYDLLWSKVLDNISVIVNSLVYNTWFEKTKLQKIENNEATIIVPTEIHRKHLNDKYSKDIINCLFNETHQTLDLNFILEDEIIAANNVSTFPVDNSSGLAYRPFQKSTADPVPCTCIDHKLCVFLCLFTVTLHIQSFHGYNTPNSLHQGSHRLFQQ